MGPGPAGTDPADATAIRAIDPDGRVTIQTGIDMGVSPYSKHDVASIQRQTHLKGDGWERALNKKLERADYDAYLAASPKEDLVLRFWRPMIDAQKCERRGSPGS